MQQMVPMIVVVVVEPTELHSVPLPPSDLIVISPSLELCVLKD
jgi:hypothetical protein